MVNGNDDITAVDGRVVIDLQDPPVTLDLDHVDIHVNGGIDFEVAGRIENVEDDVLEALSGRTLSPSEIHFVAGENAD